MRHLPVPELLLVMPVHNEQATVADVVREWVAAVEKLTPNFCLLAIDDGSSDGSLAVLRQLAGELGPRLEIIDQPNRGHGQCCLQGYRIAAARGIPHVFQFDSDGQCDPRYFASLWELRHDHDVVYGRRTRRDDGWRRVLASRVVRGFLLVLFGVNCADANVPYRLMRSACLPPFLDRIAEDFSLANIALAVLLRRDPAVREGSVPIGFRQRAGGEPSVPLRGFGRKALELYRQLRALPDEPRGGVPASKAAALEVHSATGCGGDCSRGASQRP